MLDVACLPLKKNVPEGREDWQLVECEVCGAECWRNVELLNQVKAINPNVKEMCTLCAIKQRMK